MWRILEMRSYERAKAEVERNRQSDDADLDVTPMVSLVNEIQAAVDEEQAREALRRTRKNE
jgi:hypothetical protein